MKKLFAIILCVISGFALVSCNDIKETINELKKIAISETVNVLTDELGIDDFYIPECETLNLGINYDSTSDKSEVSLEIINTECEVAEYKDQLVDYIEEALNESGGLFDSSDFEPVEVENGYEWNYSITLTDENGSLYDVVFDVLLTKVDNDICLNVSLEGAGNIKDLIKEQLEKIENIG